MIVRGRVKNGVVVLDAGNCLSEGSEVNVIQVEPAEKKPHSIMDIPPVSLGGVLAPLTDEDDLLDEMLQGRS